MGLTLIIMLIVTVITLCERFKKEDESNPDLLFRLFITAVICIAIFMPVSAYISASSAEDNSRFARRVVEENVEQLQEIQPGVYVMTVYEHTRGVKHPSLHFKVNNEPKRINLNNIVVYCNASEAKMITRKTKLKNELLSFLLFDFARTEKELYTPEKMIYGEYGFIESAK